jgi:hypothetical protein
MLMFCLWEIQDNEPELLLEATLIHHHCDALVIFYFNTGGHDFSGLICFEQQSWNIAANISKPDVVNHSLKKWRIQIGCT